MRAFPDEISSLPRQSGSIESSPFPLPYINGHSAREASPSVPQLQLTTSLSRQSTISDMPRTGYVLPPLRLGPTPSPVDMSLLRRPPSVPASAGSSPRPIPASRSSGRSSLASPNRASSLGSRAMSLVGSSSGRSSISMAESEGTVGEEVLAVNGMKKEKGLKRFGSLMRRKN